MTGDTGEVPPPVSIRRISKPPPGAPPCTPGPIPDPILEIALPRRRAGKLHDLNRNKSICSKDRAHSHSFCGIPLRCPSETFIGGSWGGAVVIIRGHSNSLPANRHRQFFLSLLKLLQERRILCHRSTPRRCEMLSCRSVGTAVDIVRGRGLIRNPRQPQR